MKFHRKNRLHFSCSLALVFLACFLFSCSLFHSDETINASLSPESTTPTKEISPPLASPIISSEEIPSIKQPEQIHVSGNNQGEEVFSEVELTTLSKPFCGSCHQSTLPTAKAGALAIFDLDKPGWFSLMSSEQLEGFSRRISGKLEEEQSQKIVAFLKQEIVNRKKDD